MERVNAILRHPVFIGKLHDICDAERERIFCRHGMSHCLDAARIACILAAERGEPFDREIIYAAALLHDIGRAEQYAGGVPHERASAVIAAVILPECGFDRAEAETVTEAISMHRTADRKSAETAGGLAGLLSKADKLSRACYDCAAFDECNWEVKNTGLEY